MTRTTLLAAVLPVAALAQGAESGAETLARCGALYTAILQNGFDGAAAGDAATLDTRTRAMQAALAAIYAQTPPADIQGPDDPEVLAGIAIGRQTRALRGHLEDGGLEHPEVAAAIATCAPVLADPA